MFTCDAISIFDLKACELPSKISSARLPSSSCSLTHFRHRTMRSGIIIAGCHAARFHHENESDSKAPVDCFFSSLVNYLTGNKLLDCVRTSRLIVSFIRHKVQILLTGAFLSLRNCVKSFKIQ